MNGRIGVATTALLMLASCGESTPQPSPRVHAPTPFDVTFVDRTSASGIDARHSNLASADKLLPETMGSGVALLDFDGDGMLDLFFVDSRARGPFATGTTLGVGMLYRGRGDGTFEWIGVLNAGEWWRMGVSVADYDGDGDDDLFITGVRENELMRNDGGTFVRVTDAAGLASPQWLDRNGEPHPEWSTASVWFDADGDGDIDLFVGNYVQWTRETEIFTTLDGVSKAITTPDRYPGLPCRLFLNRGDGTFEDASERAGLLAHPGKALGIALWDFDADGKLDVVVANDTQPNFLFLNRSTANAPSFEERGVELGIAYDDNGRARAGMGIDVADYDNSGVESIAIGNFSGETMSLYRKQSERGFRNAATQLGLASPTLAPLTFGLVFADVDLDGRQDLIALNGHIEPEIARFQPGTSFAQPPLLLRALDGGMFADVSARAGADFITPRVGRGLAYGDLDGDGDIDLVLTTSGGPAAVLENRAQQTTPRHYLRVDLHGKGRNTRAIGALVTLRAGGITQRRYVRTGSSYLSASESTLTFGLSLATTSAPHIDELRVRWPSGVETVEQVDALDRTLRIEER